MYKGLVRKYKDPFPILERVRKVAYKVQLPPKLKIHNVFHMSMLKPFHQDEEDPNRGVSQRALTGIVIEYDRKIEAILAHRMVSRKGGQSHTEYLVKWQGLSDTETSWEGEEQLWQYSEMIEDYWERLCDEGVASLSGGGCHVSETPLQIL